RVQSRRRPELRDDAHAGSPAGGQALPNANSNRMVDTAAIAMSDDWILGLEFCYVLGPFSVQAEYGWNFVQNARGIAPTGVATFNPPIVPAQDYVFSGGGNQPAHTPTGPSPALHPARGPRPPRGLHTRTRTHTRRA